MPYRYRSTLINDVSDTSRPLHYFRMSKKTKKKASDPVADQLRFEAQFYGDWYSESILSTYEWDRGAAQIPAKHSSASEDSLAQAQDAKDKSKH